MRNLSSIASTILLLPVVAGYAASSEPPVGNAETRLERAAEMLAKRADADSQAAAGLLSASRLRNQSLHLVAQASLIAPERADLVWLHIQLCQSDASCDPVPLESRLRDLDGKNGAGWLGALYRASKRGDEEAKSSALAAIGRSERLDSYWNTLTARLSRQVASTKMVSLSDAEVVVIGALAALAIPGYAALSNACRGDQTRDDVVQACRGAAKSLLNGDTVITEMVGIAIAKRAWPENSPKWVEATEARRLLDYRGQFGDIVYEWILANANDYLVLCEKLRREQDVYKAVLIATGKNPDPPAIKSEPAQIRSP